MREHLTASEALKALTQSPLHPQHCRVTQEAKASGKPVLCHPQSHRTSLPRILPLRNVRSPLLLRPSRHPRLTSRLAERTDPPTNQLPAATEREQKEDSDQRRALPVHPELLAETLPPDLCPSLHPLPLPHSPPPF